MRASPAPSPRRASLRVCAVAVRPHQSTEIGVQRWVKDAADMLEAGKPWAPVSELQNVNAMEVRSQTRPVVTELIKALKMPETTEEKARVLEGFTHALRVHKALRRPMYARTGELRTVTAECLNSVVEDEALYSNAVNVRQIAEAIPRTIEACPEFWARLEATPSTLHESAETLEAVVAVAGLLTERGVLKPTDTLRRELRMAFDELKGDMPTKSLLRCARWMLMEMAGDEAAWREACVATVRDTVLGMRPPLKRSEISEATGALAAAGVPIEGALRDVILGAYIDGAHDMSADVHRVVLNDLAQDGSALPPDAAARVAAGVSLAVLNGPATPPRTANSLLTCAMRLRLPLDDQCLERLYRRATADPHAWSNGKTTILLLRKLGKVGLRAGGQLPVHVQQGMRAFIPDAPASDIVTLVVAFASLRLQVHGKTREAIAARMLEAVPAIENRSLHSAVAGLGCLRIPVEGELHAALLARLEAAIPELNDVEVLKLTVSCGRSGLVLSDETRAALRARVLAALPDVDVKGVWPIAEQVHAVFRGDGEVAGAAAAAVTRHAPELGVNQLLHAARGLARVEHGAVDDKCRAAVGGRASELLAESSAAAVATLVGELGRLEVRGTEALHAAITAQLQRVCPRIANQPGGNSGELCCNLTWSIAKLGVELGESDKMALREAMGRATSVGPSSEKRLRWAVKELGIPL